MISVDEPHLLNKFVDGVREIYQDRHNTFDPYQYRISIRRYSDYINLYFEQVNDTMFKDNNFREVFYRVNQINGDIQRLRYSKIPFGNLYKDTGLTEFRKEHERLRKFNASHTFSEDVWRGLMCIISVYTRMYRGEDIIKSVNIIMIDPKKLESLYNEGYANSKSITKKGEHVIKELIEMGFDYRYADQY